MTAAAAAASATSANVRYGVVGGKGRYIFSSPQEVLHIVQITPKYIRPLVVTGTKKSVYQAVLLSEDPEVEQKNGKVVKHYLTFFYRSRKHPELNIDRLYEIGQQVLTDERLDFLKAFIEEMNARELLKYLCDDSHTTTMELSVKSVLALEQCIRNQKSKADIGKMWRNEYTTLFLSDFPISREHIGQYEKVYNCRKCAAEAYFVNGFNHEHLMHASELKCMHQLKIKVE